MDEGRFRSKTKRDATKREEERRERILNQEMFPEKIEESAESITGVNEEETSSSLFMNVLGYIPGVKTIYDVMRAAASYRQELKQLEEDREFEYFGSHSGGYYQQNDSGGYYQQSDYQQHKSDGDYRRVPDFEDEDFEENQQTSYMNAHHNPLSSETKETSEEEELKGVTIE